MSTNASTRYKPVNLDLGYVKILKVLDGLELEYAIMGGFPRDLALGIEPKDMDVAVYNFNSNAIVDLLKYLMDEDILLLEHHNASMVQDSRIKCVFTTTVGIDFIFWDMQYTGFKQILKNFDVNLNQFVLVPMNNGMYEPYFWGNGFGTLTELRGDIPTTANEARKYKMQQKALSLGWDVPNVMEDPSRVVPFTP